MDDRVLDVTGLRAGYGPAEVLFGVELHLARGEVAALMGRNGAGKSTTLKVIMGLLPPRGGSVRFAGQEIAGVVHPFDDRTALRAELAAHGFAGAGR